MRTSRARVMVALLLFVGTALGVAPAAAASGATSGVRAEAAPQADIDRRMQNCYSSVTVLHYWRSENPGYYYSIAQARWTPTDTDEIRVPYGYWAEVDEGSVIRILQGNVWYPIPSQWHGKCVYIHTSRGLQNPSLGQP